MISRSVSCSWCHTMNSLDDPDKLYCHHCGHRADLPMSQCDCPQCTSPRQPLTEADVEELLRRIAREIPF